MWQTWRVSLLKLSYKMTTAFTLRGFSCAPALRTLSVSHMCPYSFCQARGTSCHVVDHPKKKQVVWGIEISPQHPEISAIWHSLEKNYSVAFQQWPKSLGQVSQSSPQRPHSQPEGDLRGHQSKSPSAKDQFFTQWNYEVIGIFKLFGEICYKQ